MIFASFNDYLPLGDLLEIVLVGIGVAIVAPSAASLVITGFETQARSHRSGEARLAGEVRIALGVAVIAALIALGIYAVAFP
jgi:hypothetical protein